jgi:hypothetical protein
MLAATAEVGVHSNVVESDSQGKKGKAIEGLPI